MKAIAAVVALLCLAGASAASGSLREQAIALERACKGVEAVKLYIRAARGGDAKAAKRLSEIYDQGIDGVPRDFAESLKWKDEALRLGDITAAFRPQSAGPPSPCKPRPLAQRGPAPASFEFRMTFLPRGGSDGVEFRRDGLVFESRRMAAVDDPTGKRFEMKAVETVTVKPSVAQWRAFRQSLDRLNVWQWQPRYHAPVLDGTGWSLQIEYADRRLVANGHNSHPASFEAFLEAVNTLLGSRKFR
ncbi:MAG: hypothetical protein AB1452_09635 [Pseudomonadota bacterium]